MSEEPKTTDYCARCGESPESGSHLPHGHEYVDPRVRDPAIKTKQFAHQAKLYLEQRNARFFALHWEMGLGKTKLTIDVASHLFLTGQIDAVLVVAPNEVFLNWLQEEMPRHMAAPYVGMAARTKGSKSERTRMKQLMMLNRDDPDFRGKLRFVCVSYDGLRVEATWEFVKKFAMIYRTMIIADECSRIKNRNAQQTKRAKTLAEYCPVRWEVTGTPATESPFGLHSQIEFLDPNFWAQYGLRSYSAFKTRFGEFELRRMGKRVFNQLKQYRGLDDLRRMIAPISSRLLKEDSEVDLPPKLYTTRRFDMAEEQARLYAQVRDQFLAELDGGMILEASLAVVRLTRLQQIACGHATVDQYESYDETEDEELERQLSFDDSPRWDEQVQRPLSVEIIEDATRRALATPEAEAAARAQWGDGDGEVPRLAGSQLAEPQSYEEVYARVQQGIQDVAASGESGKMRTDPVIAEAAPLKSTRKTIDVIPPKDNPRLKLLVHLVEQATQNYEVARPRKVIVFCRFRRDVDLIVEHLNALGCEEDDDEEFGKKFADRRGEFALRYDGAVKHGVRPGVLKRFRDSADPSRVLVANVHAMSMGVTLTIAKTMIFYSNSFSLEKRLQAEDRFHRIGQDQSVQLIDIVGNGTVDEHVVKSMREKFEIQTMVTGDRLREWLNMRSEA